jgi:hypothetical protein
MVDLLIHSRIVIFLFVKCSFSLVVTKVPYVAKREGQKFPSSPGHCLNRMIETLNN